MANYNYFNRLTISSGTFATNPDVSFNIGGSSFSFINEGNGTISYSFDGTTIHGDLVPGTASAQMAFGQRGQTNIWFKLSSGAASAIRVEACQGTVSIGGAPSFQPVSGTAAPGSTASGNPVQVGAVYNTAAPTPSTGQIEPLQCDSLGNLQSNLYTAIAGEDLGNNVLAVSIKPVAASTYTPSAFTNFGANATLNVKASAGNVMSLTCLNKTATVRYLQLHNSATTSSGAPVQAFLVPANSQIVIGSDYFTASGLYFSTGIAFGCSTTADTYTAATTTDHTTIINFI